MSKNESNLTMRCPICLEREVDVLLLCGKQTYYCVKCSYNGDEQDVRSRYAGIRAKYRNRTRRLSLDDIVRL